MLDQEEERQHQREPLGTPHHPPRSPSRSSDILRRRRRPGRSSTRRPAGGCATATATAIATGTTASEPGKAGRRRGAAGMRLWANGGCSPRGRGRGRVTLAEILERHDGAVCRGVGSRLGPRSAGGGEIVYFRRERRCASDGGITTHYRVSAVITGFASVGLRLPHTRRGLPVRFSGYGRGCGDAGGDDIVEGYARVWHTGCATTAATGTAAGLCGGCCCWCRTSHWYGAAATGTGPCTA